MPCGAPATPRGKPRGLASSGFARHYSRNLVLISSPRGTEMFHFPRCRSARLCIQRAVAGQTPAGFPHSEIPGSKPARGSPGHIAASRVLHRLLVPRHPSCARIRLTGSGTEVPAGVATSTQNYAIVKEHPAAPQKGARGSGPRRLRGGKPVSVARGEPVVGVPGVEPGTSSLSGTRSNQLSYTPDAPEARLRRGRRPQPSTTNHRPPTRNWWRQPGSNR